MNFKFKPWQLAAGMILLCGLTVGIVHWRRTVNEFDTARLFQYLPADRTVKLYIDFAQLRDSGLLSLLAASSTAQEPDYRKFVQDTGFDYMSDLDAVAASFAKGDTYLAIKGQFNWRKLSDYAITQGGQCLNTICSMPASQPNRNISFYPLASNVLAMAVSPEDRKVVSIGPPAAFTPMTIPSQPIWISAPGSAFSDLSAAPSGSRSFLSPLSQAIDSVFSIGPTKGPSQEKGGTFEIRLDATCFSPVAAKALAGQFSDATDLLTKMIHRENMTPNPADLSGLLVSGHFEAQSDHAIGTWPLDRRFLQNLVSGKLQ